MRLLLREQPALTTRAASILDPPEVMTISLLNMVPRLEISIDQDAEDACRIHHRGRTERVMGEP